MKTIIAGSRSLIAIDMVYAAIAQSNFVITEVVCGGANGVDLIGKQWGASRGIPVKDFPPDWKQFGRAAGPIRNRQMATYADALIAIWDGKSRGTRSMIDLAHRQHLKVFIHQIDGLAAQSGKQST